MWRAIHTCGPPFGSSTSPGPGPPPLQPLGRGVSRLLTCSKKGVTRSVRAVTPAGLGGAGRGSMWAHVGST